MTEGTVPFIEGRHAAAEGAQKRRAMGGTESDAEARAEDRDEPYDDPGGQDQYERHLDELGGSR